MRLSRGTIFLMFLVMTGVVAGSGVSSNAEKLDSMSALKPGTRIDAYLFGRDRMADLYQIGLYWDEKLDLQKGCSSQYQVKTIGLALLEPINFPDQKPHPIEGIWKIGFGFERCGQTKIYNAIFLAKNGTKPEVKPYYPGVTKASPLLIRDALKGSYPAASIKWKRKNDQKDCQNLNLVDMRITQQPHDIVDGGKMVSGVWQEEWTFQGCGASVEVLMNFTPDGSGGTTYSTTN